MTAIGGRNATTGRWPTSSTCRMRLPRPLRRPCASRWPLVETPALARRRTFPPPRAVAAACGNVTRATAVAVPNLIASNSVIRLPIPNPTTEAVAPESSATMNTATRNTGQVLETPTYGRRLFKRGIGRASHHHRTISALARTVRSDSRQDPRFGSGGPRDQFPSGCENEVPPSSTQR